MQEINRIAIHENYHEQLLRRSEAARLAQAVDAGHGLSLYRLVGQRLVNWGEMLQQANARRAATLQTDYRLHTSELPSV